MVLNVENAIEENLPLLKYKYMILCSYIIKQNGT
jgi:hypothetical protein